MESNKRFSLDELNGRPLRLLIGGFPCTKFSIAQKSEDREIKPYSGEGWELFYNYLLVKEKFKPDFFLAENNQSTAQAIKNEVSRLLRVNYIPIDSALVSAQTRKRVYWTNIPNIKQPKDRGILLKDILDSGTVDRDKSLCIGRRYSECTGSQSYLRRRYFSKSFYQIVFEDCSPEYQKELWRKDDRKEYKDQIGYVRQLTAEEVEKLQTLPVGYTAELSGRKRYGVLGNGWTAEVIIHILSHIGVPTDYPIEVLAMYDGIATGRYCLEKLGYTNITYKAYEIDPDAIRVAMKNYPDIIQCGDAYQVRDDNWEY